MSNYNAVLDVSFSQESSNSLSLSDVKNWLKIDLNDEDAILQLIVTAARIEIENYVNLSLVERTVTANIVNRLGNFILPYGPVKAISSYTDLLNNANDYTSKMNLINESFEGSGIVVYTAGFAILPANLRIAWLQQCAFMYEHRGDGSAGDLSHVVKTSLKAIRRI